MQHYPLHHFYIPVMGTGFTIDSALFVGKYGIDTVVSLVDDYLIEKMREYWSNFYSLPYEPITNKDEDPRAHRITAYLNLLKKLLDEQIKRLRDVSFDDEELNNFFRLLPDEHEARQKYLMMLNLSESNEKKVLQEQLKRYLRPGKINVNIMAKLDPGALDQNVDYKMSAAAAALRGFAESDLDSSIILSAGFNPFLYSYLATLEDFYPDKNGNFPKQVCLKVSDYRSALIQGKFLAKKGIWVSEYRFESPINCGGHAFINDGTLMGPILEEFSVKKEELRNLLWPIYQETLLKKKNIALSKPLGFAITAQGGIGTAEEHQFLRKKYHLDAVGWGSPFLLASDVTNVDEDTLIKFTHLKSGDIFLSESSPLGVLFWNLRNSLSEEKRIARIKDGKPGSPCVRGFVKFNRDFTPYPLCLASHEYQKAKLLAIEKSELSDQEKAEQCEKVLAKACICNDLAGGVFLKRGINAKATTAICPGPNLFYFQQRLTLRTLVDHIYGRKVLELKGRPHVFLNELRLHLNFWKKDVEQLKAGKKGRSAKVLIKVKEVILNGINYYKQIFYKNPNYNNFIESLLAMKQELESISVNEQ